MFIIIMIIVQSFVRKLLIFSDTNFIIKTKKCFIAEFSNTYKNRKKIMNTMYL